jgi:hypothetical protein
VRVVVSSLLPVPLFNRDILRRAMFLTFTAMQSRSACSRAAQPCDVCPEDAQQPVARSQHRAFFLNQCGFSQLQIVALCKLEDQHTQHCAHHTQTRVCIRLVGLSYAQLGERRQFGRSSGARELVCGVLAGDHD